MLVGIEVLSSDEAAGRAMQGVVTGMGFIGGGAILKGNGSVTGMATAASLMSPAFGGWRNTLLVIGIAVLGMGILWVFIYRDREKEGAAEVKRRLIQEYCAGTCYGRHHPMQKGLSIVWIDRPPDRNPDRHPVGTRR